MTTIAAALILAACFNLILIGMKKLKDSDRY